MNTLHVPTNTDMITIPLSEYRELTGICRKLLDKNNPSQVLIDILRLRAHRAKLMHKWGLKESQ